MEKLIDTDALEGGKFHSIEDWTPVEIASWQRGWNDAIDAIISNVSTVDAEEVVRCKDCKHCVGGCCQNFVTIRSSVDAYDYCSWGEREDGSSDN